jgi:HAD superfamily hydrolase (TIGR01509 family)
MTAAPVRLVIFDCDGVLVDSEPIAMRVLLETLSRSGLPLSPEMARPRFLGKSLAAISGAVLQEFGIELTSSALDAMRVELYEAFRLELKAVDGVEAALQALRIPFCVASSSELERIRLSLKITGLLRYFEPFIFSASMVAAGKPAPDLFLYAAQTMQTAPEYCLVIEDSAAGVESALRAGMRVCAFLGGSHASDTTHLSSITALGLFQTFSDMRLVPDLVREPGYPAKGP